MQTIELRRSSRARSTIRSVQGTTRPLLLSLEHTIIPPILTCIRLTSTRATSTRREMRAGPIPPCRISRTPTCPTPRVRPTSSRPTRTRCTLQAWGTSSRQTRTLPTLPTCPTSRRPTRVPILRPAPILRLAIRMRRTPLLVRINSRPMWALPIPLISSQRIQVDPTLLRAHLISKPQYRATQGLHTLQRALATSSRNSQPTRMSSILLPIRTSNRRRQTTQMSPTPLPLLLISSPCSRAIQTLLTCPPISQRSRAALLILPRISLIHNRSNLVT